MKLYSLLILTKNIKKYLKMKSTERDKTSLFPSRTLQCKQNCVQYTTLIPPRNLEGLFYIPWYHKYPSSKTVESSVLQKTPTLIGVWKWELGDCPTTPIVRPTLGRRQQHVAQRVIFVFLKMFMKHVNLKILTKNEIMICGIHCFTQNKIPKLMTSRGVP